MTIPHVRLGQTVSHSQSRENAIADAANMMTSATLRAGQGRRFNPAAIGVIWVRNDTGSDLTVGTALWAGEVLTTENPAATPALKTVYAGTYAKPDTGICNPCITLQPVKTDGVICCAVTGAAYIRNLPDDIPTDAQFVKIEDDGSLTAGTEGDIKLLCATEAGGGVALLGAGGSGGGAMLVVITQRPPGGFGPATAKAIKLADNGTWTADGDDIPVVIPKM